VGVRSLLLIPHLPLRPQGPRGATKRQKTRPDPSDIDHHSARAQSLGKPACRPREPGRLAQRGASDDRPGRPRQHLGPAPCGDSPGRCRGRGGSHDHRLRPLRRGSLRHLNRDGSSEGPVLATELDESPLPSWMAFLLQPLQPTEQTSLLAAIRLNCYSGVKTKGVQETTCKRPRGERLSP